MGRLPHPAGEGRLETKEKAPIAECLPQMGSLRIHPPLCFFNRRWYACKQRRRRYCPVNPVTYSHSGAQRYSVPGAKASHHRL